MTTATASWRTTTSTTTCTRGSRSGKAGWWTRTSLVPDRPGPASSNLLFTFRTGSNPKIRRNKIWGGQNGGILVYNSGEPLRPRLPRSPRRR